MRVLNYFILLSFVPVIFSANFTLFRHFYSHFTTADACGL